MMFFSPSKFERTPRNGDGKSIRLHVRSRVQYKYVCTRVRARSYTQIYHFHRRRRSRFRSWWLNTAPYHSSQLPAISVRFRNERMCVCAIVHVVCGNRPAHQSDFLHFLSDKKYVSVRFALTQYTYFVYGSSAWSDAKHSYNNVRRSRLPRRWNLTDGQLLLDNAFSVDVRGPWTVSVPFRNVTVHLFTLVGCVFSRHLNGSANRTNRLRTQLILVRFSAQNTYWITLETTISTCNNCVVRVRFGYSLDSMLMNEEH